MATSPSSIDVAIVGAGLAGLTAAWTLHKKGISSLAVFEAMNRVGGRTLIQPVHSDSYVEQGGTWAGPSQTAILALAVELGVGIKNGKPEGSTFYGYQGRWTQVDGEVGSSEVQDDFASALERFEALSKTVVTTAPWTTPNAVALDALSIGQWIRANTQTEGGRFLFEGCVRKMQGGDPDEVSLLWLLHFVASATFEDLLHTAENYRFAGGSQAISFSIAERLGNRVHTATPVSRISVMSDSTVRIEGDGFPPVTARRAIVTAMPTALKAITFDPPLSSLQQDMIESWTPMSWIKFNAIYETPFWRGKISGSQFLCLDRRVEAFDISPEDESLGEIVGFLLPDCPNRHGATASHFAKQFLRQVYGAGADEPRYFAIKDWSAETRIGGCVSSLKPCILTRIGSALTAPAGPVHFAGTERSPYWLNYMEGAVRSGQRTAERVAGELALTASEEASV